MSDMKLFRISGTKAVEVQGSGLALEKSLQTLIELNLPAFLGVTFLASEFPTGPEHGGRLDTLGLDEKKCPVIIQYKRSTNMNVINQGLFYLDWLVTHRDDFEMLVLKTIGIEAAQVVEWSSPRLICIAGDFSKFDAHAIKQMNRNILGSSFKCNTQSPQGIGCCDGQTKQAPQQRGTCRDIRRA